MDLRRITTALLLLVITYLSFPGCRKDENPVAPSLEKKDTLSVSVYDRTVVSITLKVSLKGSTGKWSFSLSRILDNRVDRVDTFAVYGTDTLIYDMELRTNLRMDTTYLYKVKLLDRDDTASVYARTLELTSQKFEWTEYKFGILGSQFTDVWGTSPNNVYACGPVVLKRDDKVIVRGLWHWNGVEWSPEESVTSGAFDVMYGFGENDIWAAGGAVYHYDGIKWKRVDAQERGYVIYDSVLFHRGITCMWGTSSSNLYFGTWSAKLIYWNGKKARNLDCPGHNCYTDIYGTGPNDIYLTTGELSTPQLGELFHYDGQNWTMLIKGTNPLSSLYDLHGPFASVWKYDKDHLFLTGGSTYVKHEIGDWYQMEGYGGTAKIRGTKPNNIFTCGSNGFVAHYNGEKFKKYFMNNEVFFVGLYVTGDEVFVCGYNKSDQAVIYHGKRIK